MDIADYLFDTEMSLNEIALATNLDIEDLLQEIEHKGLSWVIKQKEQSRRKVSRGQNALTFIMKKLLPGEEIRTEEPLGERLRLDVYCPRYRLAAEYHGRQHFEYVEHFHGDIYGFRESQKRDERKKELCQEKGITLVVFSYSDTLTEDVVFHRLLTALKESDFSANEEKLSFYEIQKEKRRQYLREQYRRIKRTGRNK